jgi:NADH-quinone oxidoreductase subunit N
VALALVFFLVSLAGVPPTAGFFGKFYVFKSAIDSGLYELAIVGLINSVIGAYYYLKVIVFLYMREPKPGAAVALPMRSGLVSAALLIAAVLVAVLGVMPGRALTMAQAAGLLG